MTNGDKHLLTYLGLFLSILLKSVHKTLFILNWVLSFIFLIECCYLQILEPESFSNMRFLTVHPLSGSLFNLFVRDLFNGWILSFIYLFIYLSYTINLLIVHLFPLYLLFNSYINSQSFIVCLYFMKFLNILTYFCDILSQ